MAGMRIGTAGWNVPAALARKFPEEGSHLTRYASRLSCVEVNSTFTRSHRPATWRRWAAAVPSGFRFAVKAPKAVTHEARLVRCGALLQQFFSEVHHLGDALGPVLVQLPPKLAFDGGIAREFLMTVRELYTGAVAVEPRHASWFTPEPGSLLREFGMARVAADPPAGSAAAAVPGGWCDLIYRRLHGSPRVYSSGYSSAFLDALAQDLRHDQQTAAEVWCIFDNTALGEAAGDALALQTRLPAGPATTL